MKLCFARWHKGLPSPSDRVHCDWELSVCTTVTSENIIVMLLCILAQVEQTSKCSPPLTVWSAPNMTITACSGIWCDTDKSDHSQHRWRYHKGDPPRMHGDSIRSLCTCLHIWCLMLEFHSCFIWGCALVILPSLVWQCNYVCQGSMKTWKWRHCQYIKCHSHHTI